MADQQMLEPHRKTWHGFVKLIIYAVAVAVTLLLMAAFLLYLAIIWVALGAFGLFCQQNQCSIRNVNGTETINVCGDVRLFGHALRRRLARISRFITH